MDKHEDFKLLLLQFLIKHAEDTVNFLAEVEGDRLELHPPGLNLGQVQNIVDERTNRKQQQRTALSISKN